ncbi:uncharacterized protein LOC144152785 [Haemaphysalis longicornis]
MLPSVTGLDCPFSWSTTKHSWREHGMCGLGRPGWQLTWAECAARWPSDCWPREMRAAASACWRPCCAACTVRHTLALTLLAVGCGGSAQETMPLCALWLACWPHRWTTLCGAPAVPACSSKSAAQHLALSWPISGCWLDRTRRSCVQLSAAGRKKHHCGPWPVAGWHPKGVGGPLCSF